MVIGMLPGTVLAVGTSPLLVQQSDTSAQTTSPNPGTISNLVAGTSVTLTPSVNLVAPATVLANTTFTITTLSQITVGGVKYAPGSLVPFASCSAAGVCKATVAWNDANLAAQYLIKVVDSIDASANNEVDYTATVIPAAVASLKVTGLAGGALPLTETTLAVSAVDAFGNLVKTDTNTVYFQSVTDPTATVPVATALVGGTLGSLHVTWDTAGTQSITVTDPLLFISGSQTGIVVTGTPAAAGTYYPLATPTRFLDTRYGTGLSGAFQANVSRTFQVASTVADTAGTIVPKGAIAVTGNLTVTDATSGWAFYLGPTATNSPTTSSINFVAGQTKANNVTVPLAADGTLSATYISSAGQTADLVFDVTGYFYGGHAYTGFSTLLVGEVYMPLATPARVIDTRFTGSIPGPSAKVVANQPICYTLALPAPDTADFATNAKAVTGILTVTGATSGWAVAVGPTLASVTSPAFSNINFVAGETKANGVTVALGTGHTLCIDYISTTPNTVDVVFDVTGYFKNYSAPGTGDFYMPIAPVRMVDSRLAIGLPSAVPANTPWSFQVTSGTTGAPVPVAAKAVTGNLTVTNSTAGWALYLGPAPVLSPLTSSINFTAGMVTSNSLDVGLSAGGTLSTTYISTTGNTTAVVFDVTGYFTTAI
jgi:hypothetical protein